MNRSPGALQFQPLLDHANQIDLRQQVTDGAVDTVTGGRDAILRGDGARAVVHGERDRLLLAAGQAADQRHLAAARTLADHALIGRLRDADLGLGHHQVGARAFQARFGLRHVGDGGPPTRKRSRVASSCSISTRDVVATRIGDGDVLHEIGIRCHGGEQDVLLGVG